MYIYIYIYRYCITPIQLPQFYVILSYVRK